MRGNIDLVVVGKIVKCQGIKGELQLEPLTADPGRFERLKFVYVQRRDGTTQLCELEKVWYHKRRVIVKLAGYDTVDTAGTLAGSELAVKSEDLIRLAPGSYFYFQIIGLDVYTQEARHLGKVEDIFSTGSNDVYVVKDHGKEYLLPAIKDVILQVDLENKRLIINLLEGLD
ncbi:MAG: 16S rRNA processing protein RimM [Candidatus Schekmanbacteria bacterium]|nr:16S rRNA processing protein RimM [Candidatus Schekmanbacteria bacterium]